MASTTTSVPSLLTPATVAGLFLQPLLAASVAAQVCSAVTIASKSFRIPRITQDPTAAWVAEGAEIGTSDIAADEVVVTPAKVAGLSVITRELADDSSPQAAQVVGDGLARDVARKIDSAFFGNVASPAPTGLGGMLGAGGVTTVNAPATWSNTDAFTAALFEAANRNASISTWVANPQDALQLATVKESSGSARPLLSPDPTVAGRSLIAGLPLLVSTAVTAGTVWGIPRDRAILVVRDDVKVETSRDAYFSSDRVAIRATARVGFAYPQPAAVIRILKATS